MSFVELGDDLDNFLGCVIEVAYWWVSVKTDGMKLVAILCKIITPKTSQVKGCQCNRYMTNTHKQSGYKSMGAVRVQSLPILTINESYTFRSRE